MINFIHVTLVAKGLVSCALSEPFVLVVPCQKVQELRVSKLEENVISPLVSFYSDLETITGPL